MKVYCGKKHVCERKTLFGQSNIYTLVLLIYIYNIYILASSLHHTIVRWIKRLKLFATYDVQLFVTPCIYAHVTPICLVASGEKTVWLSAAGFSPYAHAHPPASPARLCKHVPNLEQRRHTNPTDLQADATGTDSFPCFYTRSWRLTSAYSRRLTVKSIELFCAHTVKSMESRSTSIMVKTDDILIKLAYPTELILVCRWIQGEVHFEKDLLEVGFEVVEALWIK